MFAALAFLLFALALALLLLSRRQRRQLGVPQGSLLYEDMLEGERLLRPLYDPELNLVGRPDYLLRSADDLVPVEVKSGRTPSRPYDSHVFQLTAYCLLVARLFGQRPSHGILRYPKRSFKINFTPQLETQLLSILKEMRRHHVDDELPRSHQQAARCRACGYLHLCDQSL